MAEVPTIQWTLGVEQVNTVLAILGKQKFDKVADLIVDLRTQAGRQMQAWQEKQQAAASPAPPAPPVKGNGLDKGEEAHAC